MKSNDKQNGGNQDNDIKPSTPSLSNTENMKIITFTSFRQASIKLDKVNHYNTIENNKKAKQYIHTSPNNNLPKKKKKETRKRTKLVPLDPKMYRITFEEYKQHKLEEELLQQNRGGSAQKKSVIPRNISHTNIKKKSTKIKTKDWQFKKQTNIQQEIQNQIKDNQINKDLNQNKKEIDTRPDIEDNKAIIIEQILLEQKDQCCYCLKECNKPITLQCSHIICSACIEENVAIESFIKPLLSHTKNTTIKCPKCSDHFSFSFPSLNLPLIPSQVTTKTTSNTKCNICKVAFVSFDCLNCDISICPQCKIIHLANPETQHHKIILYESMDKTSKDITKCPIHKITFEYFCLNENILICPKCAELLHKDHYYKRLSEVNFYFHEELKQEIGIYNKIIETIKCELNILNNITKTLANECNHFITEANKYFEDILKIIHSHNALMQNRINEWFKLKSNEVVKVTDLLNLISDRYKSLINHQPESNLDKMQQIRNIRSLNEQIAQFDFLTLKRYSYYSYQKHSAFRKIPIKQISYLMNKFSFLPLDLVALEPLINCFQNSNIIDSELITSDFLIVMPKIIEGKLIYKISEVGPSVEEFHNRCDLKGPTIMIIKTDTGHIFGGFNPFDWKNEFRYEETTSSFIFSLSDGKIRKPIRCKIKKVMKEFAIKQTEKEFSPAFGMADTSDLFIAFKQLNNSYSKLGNVYKCPKGYNGNTFLAGKADDWNIIDIEVYSIIFLNDNEYYDLN